MELPKAAAKYMQERRGIVEVQAYAARNGQIWRETGTGDVGIDGQLEFVSDGYATGRTVAVQVKCGSSFFTRPSANGWKYYPEQKHKNYWEAFPLPVILVLHDPDSGVSYWTDARQTLRTPSRTEDASINVCRTKVLGETQPIALFENAGAQEEEFKTYRETINGRWVSFIVFRSLYTRPYEYLSINLLRDGRRM